MSGVQNPVKLVPLSGHVARLPPMNDETKTPDKSATLGEGVAADVALVAAPIAVAVAPALAVATDHILNRPAEPEPPKVELPPGAERD